MRFEFCRALLLPFIWTKYRIAQIIWSSLLCQTVCFSIDSIDFDVWIICAFCLFCTKKYAKICANYPGSTASLPRYHKHKYRQIRAENTFAISLHFCHWSHKSIHGVSFFPCTDEPSDIDRCRRSINGTMDIYIRGIKKKFHYFSFVTWEIEPSELDQTFYEKDHKKSTIERREREKKEQQEKENHRKGETKTDDIW